MNCRCTAATYSRAFLLGLCILVSFEAKAKSCFLSLFIDDEYRELVKIASINKSRREELMSAPREERRALAQRHLLEAIRYEEKKARIYVSMLEKLLLQKDAFLKTAKEVRRRLQRSLGYYEKLNEAVDGIGGFEIRPIHVPMSERVTFFVNEEE